MPPTAAPDPAQDAAAPGQRLLLVGLLTSVLAVAFEAVAVATAMPRAGQDLGGLGLYAWAFTLFTLGMVLATVVAGRVSDRIGPAVPFLAGQLLFLAGLVVAGTAPSMLVLVSARFVQGLGGGAVNLTLMVVVAMAFDEHRRATVMSAFSFCWVLPAFVGPFAAGWITDHWSWHWVFRCVVPFVVVAVLLVLPSLRRLPRGADADAETSPAPLWAAAAAGLGTAALQYAGQRLDAVGAGVAVVALAALVAGVPRLMPPGMWRVGAGLPAVVWVRACLAGAFFSAEAFLPLMLVEQRGLSVTRAGLALTVGSFGWTTGSWVQARPSLPLARHQVIAVGTWCQLAGIALVAVFAAVPGLSLAVPAVGWTVAGFGMGLGIATTSLAMMTLSDEQALGRNTSSLQVGEGLGNSLMAGLAGSVFHELHGRVTPHTAFGGVFVVPVVVAVAGVLCARRIGPLRASDAVSRPAS